MIQAVVETIRSHTDFLVVSHVRPDGDSLGSQFALTLILQALGKNVEMLSRDPVPARYVYLPWRGSGPRGQSPERISRGDVRPGMRQH